ncbi:MAG TPA: SIMPL domain-containing protein [Thermomicrobiales bacterium]|nr:SIMPL domain-containing protein [Thermomicrobiales bacterium]
MSRRWFPVIALALAVAVGAGFALRPGGGGAPGRVAAAPAATPGAAADRTITVTGVGRVSVTPDLAYVTFSVETDNAALQQAQSDNAARMQAVIDRLKASGIAAQDIQTTGYHVMPTYDRDQKLTGYRVVNGVRATVRDLAQLGPTIDAAVAAGANRVQGIAFDVANKDDATKRAREAAVADAHARAAQYAQFAGVQLGGVVTIVEAGGVAPAMPQAVPAMGVPADASTPIEPGEGTITVTAQVSYEIR